MSKLILYSTILLGSRNSDGRKGTYYERFDLLTSESIVTNCIEV